MSKKNKPKNFNAKYDYEREEYENDSYKRSARKKATRSDKYGDSGKKKHNYDIGEDIDEEY